MTAKDRNYLSDELREQNLNPQGPVAYKRHGKEGSYIDRSIREEIKGIDPIEALDKVLDREERLHIYGEDKVRVLDRIKSRVMNFLRMSASAQTYSGEAAQHPDHFAEAYLLDAIKTRFEKQPFYVRADIFDGILETETTALRSALVERKITDETTLYNYLNKIALPRIDSVLEAESFRGDQANRVKASIGVAVKAALMTDNEQTTTRKNPTLYDPSVYQELISKTRAKLDAKNQQK